MFFCYKNFACCEERTIEISRISELNNPTKCTTVQNTLETTRQYACLWLERFRVWRMEDLRAKPVLAVINLKMRVTHSTTWKCCFSHWILPGSIHANTFEDFKPRHLNMAGALYCLKRDVWKWLKIKLSSEQIIWYNLDRVLMRRKQYNGDMKERVM